jgi:activator of 2-hydroxyglutaryl-CoA dehydratase
VTSPFQFVAVKKVPVDSVIHWEASWNADLSDRENVAVVPFGSEFFIAEGKTIEEGTWWDFSHPPKDANSEPLWDGND